MVYNKSNYGFIAETEEEQLEYKSRSQKKRESTALQELGEQIAKLDKKLRQQLPLSTELHAAFDELHSIKSHEARRRQQQYVGRLMREANYEEIHQAYHNLKG